MLPKEFTDFLQTCSDMELVFMQSEARQINDKDTLNAVLTEMCRRSNNRVQADVCQEQLKKDGLERFE